MYAEKEKRLYAVLHSLGITFSRHEHPPVYTVEEAQQYEEGIPGAHCKNLFLKDKNNKLYLVIMTDTKKLSFDRLSQQTNVKNLRFASPEKLEEYLGLEPGSVSPFGLINDTHKEVRVFIDRDLKGTGQINFHPNVNTATITLAYKDFERFLNHCTNQVTYIEID